jgi:DNA-directed RNA polymerase sigma subunit (sigma70/sigma32)
MDTELNNEKLHEVVDFLKEKIKVRDFEFLNDSIFTDREVRIFCTRWGIAMERKTVADMFGVTKERIRQFENKVYLKVYNKFLKNQKQ